MSGTNSHSLIAAVIGNTSMQFGYFAERSAQQTPSPLEVCTLNSRNPDFDALADWIPQAPVPWLVASVFRDAETRLSRWVDEHAKGTNYRRLSHTDFALRIDVERPDRVGADRLAAAAAANSLRSAECSAIVIDSGTAITVDGVSREGVFLGGAILPGRKLSSQALSSGTDLLPLVSPAADALPKIALGRSTDEAIQSGLFWGTVGALRELVRRITDELDADPQLFVTGGDMQSFVGVLGDEVRYVPHLVLTGVALACLLNR
jgi:type III pantothenate kinase